MELNKFTPAGPDGRETRRILEELSFQWMKQHEPELRAELWNKRRNFCDITPVSFDNGPVWLLIHCYKHTKVLGFPQPVAEVHFCVNPELANKAIMDPEPFAEYFEGLKKDGYPLVITYIQNDNTRVLRFVDRLGMVSYNTCEVFGKTHIMFVAETQKIIDEFQSVLNGGN